MNDNMDARFLPLGTVLNERYRLDEVSGEGNFGITYSGWDTLLESRVAVKEFFPVSRVSRNIKTGTEDVIVFQEEDYEEILRKYLDEAKRLSKLNQVDGIVSIRDFFYANNTAYIIMDYIEGTSIKDYVDEHGPMSAEEIMKMMNPIFNALKKVHDIGIIHRDISPDNIMLTEEGKVVLVDFGAARQVDLPEDKSMTVMIKRGYSSPELYRSRGEQGPWSDVYALSATIYYMLCGKVPSEALERILDADETIDLEKIKGVKASTEFKKAVMKGIAIKQKDRYQTVEELSEELELNLLVKKTNWKLPAVAGVVILGIGALVWSITTQASPDNEKTELASKPVTTVAPTAQATENVMEPTETPAPTPVVYQLKSYQNKTKKEVLKTIKGRKEGAIALTWKKVYSDSIASGKVVSQNKKVGTKYSVNKPLKVTFQISKGKKPQPTSTPTITKRPVVTKKPTHNQKKDYDGVIG